MIAVLDTPFPAVLKGLCLSAGLAGVAYLGFAALRVLAFARRKTPPTDGFAPGVTILKPLCGSEPELFENLSSFCNQDYEHFQVIFGVRDADDPAIAIVQRVIERFPERDLSLCVDPRVRGANLKVANLINMMERAKHDFVFVADSDTRVDRTYIRWLIGPFADPAVGAVTCLYRGASAAGTVSALGSLFINDQFAPAVLVAIALSPMDFCLGATMVVARTVLDKIGGFESLASYLADDQMLGRKVRELGFDVVLSSYIVEHDVVERDFASLWTHELRWARTMFSARPAGYAFSFITYAVPMSLIYWAVSRDAIGGAALTGVALGLRFALHYVARRALRITSADSAWLIPVRDALGFFVWAATFLGRGVRWRDQDYVIDAVGRMEKR